MLGAGADINTLNGQVLMDDLRPNAALTAVTVNGLEDETGNAANWSLTAYAVCADPVAGLERISQNSPLADSTNNKFLFPNCTGGKVLTGTGADMNTLNGQVQLNALDVGGIENVILGAIEDESGNSAPWSATGYLICAPARAASSSRASPARTRRT